MERQNTICIVSGLQRSGTSMIMQMLEKGGLVPLTDQVRKADENNPNGYYEIQGIYQKLNQGNFPIENAFNKSLKVYAKFLPILPKDQHYKIIFIERDLNEIWQSIHNISISKGQKIKSEFFNIRRREMLKSIVETAKNWIKENNQDVLFLSHSEVISHPEVAAESINAFLGNSLNQNQMAAAVLPELQKVKEKKKFWVTDRAPKSVASLIEKYAEGKDFCEIGIGEGHLLNQISGCQSKFGIEQNQYGIQRCKSLYPHLEILEGDALNFIAQNPFDVCYMWLTYPTNQKVVDAILENNPSSTIIMGLNYFYHLPDDDEKLKKYLNNYGPVAKAELWNQNIDKHLKSIKNRGFNYKVIQVIDEENDEIFSLAVINQ